MSGSAYTPGLAVTPWTEVEKVRELPLPGQALVKVGQSVQANQPVLSAELPGELDIVRVADRLGITPEDVPRHLKVEVGSEVEKQQIIAELRSFFGWFSVRVESPSRGKVEFITASTAHVGIRRPSTELMIQAYIEGEVIEVESTKSVTIRAHGAQIQGIFGVGGERHGTVFLLPVENSLRVTQDDLTAYTASLSGAIIVGGSSFSIEALRYAALQGAVAVVTGSIDSETLQAYLGYELGVSITGDEEVPLTLIITEGFGSLPLSSRVQTLAKQLSGKFGSVSGATQVRAGAVRPELFVSLPEPQEKAAQTKASSGVLDIGSRVRMIRVPYFGQFGTITALPHTPEATPCGSIVRVLRARLDSGEEVTVPRANIELSE